MRTDSENETVWLTQEEMALLFNTDRARITRHINNILKDGELDEKSNVRKTHFPHSTRPVKMYDLDMITSVEKYDGRVEHRPAKLYNLDVVLSVGYRVNSKRGIAFRKWANRVLKNYLIQGYAVNQKRLDNLGKVIYIQNRMLSYSLSKVINEYTRALDLLDVRADSENETVWLNAKGDVIAVWC